MSFRMSVCMETQSYLHTYLTYPLTHPPTDLRTYLTTYHYIPISSECSYPQRSVCGSSRNWRRCKKPVTKVQKYPNTLASSSDVRTLCITELRRWFRSPCCCFSVGSSRGHNTATFAKCDETSICKGVCKDLNYLETQSLRNIDASRGLETFVSFTLAALSQRDIQNTK